MHAQRPATTPTIGVLSPFIDSDDPFRGAFERRLKDLGYVPGRDIRLEYRPAQGVADRLPRLAQELVALNVDTIVTTSALGAQAAKHATATIPIIIAGVDDAVEQGFVSSLARPGANITGISWLNTALSAKRVQLLKQVLPATTRIGYLREAVAAASSLGAIEAASRSLGMRVVVIELRGSDEIDSAFSAMVAEGARALIVDQGPILNAREPQLVALAARHRLPTIFANRRAVEAGALMSYGPNLVALYARAADYVQRILKGAKPGSLPVEQPTSFELVVNLRTARTLGVSIPQSVLVGADDVIR